MRQKTRWTATLCLLTLLTLAPVAQAAEPGLLWSWDLGHWWQGLWTAVFGAESASGDGTTDLTPPTPDTTTQTNSDEGPEIDPIGLQADEGPQADPIG